MPYYEGPLQTKEVTYIMSISITHNAEQGTLVEGDTRPHTDALKVRGFRWSRNLGAWYLPNSRDRLPRTDKIDGLASALQSAGVEVTVSVSTAMPTTAEREANKADRLDARQDALDDKAQRRTQEAESKFGTARATADMIPFGQPILVGHHSEGRHRRDAARIETNMRAGIELGREAEDAARKADASRRNQSIRETAPATMRRLERLRTDLRDMDRKLDTATTPQRALAIRREVAAQDIAYWEAHLRALEEQGVKVWSAADFVKGDYVRTRFGSYLVLRVNKKSLTVQSEYSWSMPVTYDDVRGKTAAGEVPADLKSKVA